MSDNAHHPAHYTGALTDDHDTEYDGEHYVTPSLIDHDDGKNDDD